MTEKENALDGAGVSNRSKHSGEDNSKPFVTNCSKPNANSTENYALKEFNKNRKIIIRNVPPVTYDVSNCC